MYAPSRQLASICIDATSYKALVLIEYVSRIALTSATSLTRSRHGVFDEVRTPMRAWLTDIDINRHINNGRYLTLMDFARLDHSLRTGMMKELLKRKWWPIMGGATVSFRRELKPLSTFDITTRLLYWDEKWLYGEHRFEKDGHVHTHAYAKAVIKRGRETIPPAELMALFGHSGPPPEAHDGLRRWIEIGRSV